MSNWQAWDNLTGMLFLAILVCVFGIDVMHPEASRYYCAAVLVEAGWVFLMALFARPALAGLGHLFGFTGIVVSDQELTIKSLFHTRVIKWFLIAECGRYRTYISRLARVGYYVRLSGEEERIFLCVNDVPDSERLVRTLFRKARSARFVTLVSTVVPRRPFLTGRVPTEWRLSDPATV
ncbi:MAG TPA: hypothetical protein VGK30_05410 [Candidatus Binatia bacterium]